MKRTIRTQRLVIVGLAIVCVIAAGVITWDIRQLLAMGMDVETLRNTGDKQHETLDRTQHNLSEYVSRYIESQDRLWRAEQRASVAEDEAQRRKRQHDVVPWSRTVVIEARDGGTR